jgi:pimeloyl-ACP methyl ester carboxylesterase
MPPALNSVHTSVLEIACEESGAADGIPVFLMHGFPYDPRTYDAVVPALVAAGCRVIVPYLRGYGPTRFLAPDTPRSGQQAALGNDLKELIDGLGLRRPVLAGYDWGGRAACIVAALWPQEVRGLVSANGYNIQNIAGSAKPAPADQEHRLWYQYYFNTERGRAGLAANRGEFCKLLWRLWSPNWQFDDTTYTAPPSPSTIRTLSTSSSIPTVTASVMSRATPTWRRSSSGSPPSRAFRCRPSSCMATAAACRGRRARSRRLPSSSAPISIG